VQRTRSFFAVTLWLALLGGTVEVIVHYAAKRAAPMHHMSEDMVWMAPLVLLALTAAASGACAVLGLLGWRGGIAAGLALGSLAVALDMLLLVPGLAPPAAAVLALGLAVQWTRMALPRADRIRRAARTSTLILLPVLLAGGWWLWQSLRPDLAAYAGPATGPADRPNIVFITLDTVRAANLGLYGYPRSTTPSLERLAARGTVFDAAFSTAPWTLPSHASMFTGRWPHELSADVATPLDGRAPTLAEALTAEGYRTAGFAANLSYVSHETGLGRGFQHYEDYPRSLGQLAVSSRLARTVADNFRLRRLIENDEHLNRVHAPDLGARALAWIDRHRDAPFFVFLNYFDAHEPYLPPAPYDRKFGSGRQHGRHSPLHHWLWNPVVGHSNMGQAERQEEIDAYDGALAALDNDLGRWFAEFERRGLLENTIIVITSDHGEEFGEHGVYDHGYSLYVTGVHVPLVIIAPGRAPAGRRVVTPVSLRDLPRTVMALAGLDTGMRFPGVPLDVLWSDEAGREAVSPAFFEVEPSPGQPDWFPSSKGVMVGAIVGNHHYIRNGDGREELYDWVGDPGETRDLAPDPLSAGVVAAARSAIDRAKSEARDR
jgi:arylsulfatase A-like enzyme